MELFQSLIISFLFQIKLAQAQMVFSDFPTIGGLVKFNKFLETGL